MTRTTAGRRLRRCGRRRQPGEAAGLHAAGRHGGDAGRVRRPGTDDAAAGSVLAAPARPDGCHPAAGAGGRPVPTAVVAGPARRGADRRDVPASFRHPRARGRQCGLLRHLSRFVPAHTVRPPGRRLDRCRPRGGGDRVSARPAGLLPARPGGGSRAHAPVTAGAGPAAACARRAGAEPGRRTTCPGTARADPSPARPAQRDNPHDRRPAGRQHPADSGGGGAAQLRRGAGADQRSTTFAVGDRRWRTP